MACCSPARDIFNRNKCYWRTTYSSSGGGGRKARTVVVCVISERRENYNPIVFQAAKLLGPPSTFEESKLKVVFAQDEMDKYTGIINPRTYTLSHCDLTAELTLAISRVISVDQVRVTETASSLARINRWYSRDDVVAEWKKVKEGMCLNIHCRVGGPNVLADFAAEFRYHIFTKELPLVLKAILHGDSIFFKEHSELMEASVWVCFHFSSSEYNHVECWGPLRDAAEKGKPENYEIKVSGTSTSNEVPRPSEKWGIPKSVFQSLVALLL